MSVSSKESKIRVILKIFLVFYYINTTSLQADVLILNWVAYVNTTSGVLVLLSLKKYVFTVLRTACVKIRFRLHTSYGAGEIINESNAINMMLLRSMNQRIKGLIVEVAQSPEELCIYNKWRIDFLSTFLHCPNGYVNPLSLCPDK